MNNFWEDIRSALDGTLRWLLLLSSGAMLIAYSISRYFFEIPDFSFYLCLVLVSLPFFRILVQAKVCMNHRETKKMVMNLMTIVFVVLFLSTISFLGIKR